MANELKIISECYPTIIEIQIPWYYTLATE